MRLPSLIRLVLNHESPLPWVLRRSSLHPIDSDDPGLEAERFFRRVVSDRAWERLSDAQRDSRRRDGPALLNDLRTVRSESPPFDLAQLRVPSTYIHGDGHGVEYYRELSQRLMALNPLISAIEIEHAGHDAHLKNAGELASVVTRTLGGTVRVGVSGSSGLIGRALTQHLRDRGDEVVAFVRPDSSVEGPTIRWDPSRGVVDERDLTHDRSPGRHRQPRWREYRRAPLERAPPTATSSHRACPRRHCSLR